MPEVSRWLPTNRLDAFYKDSDLGIIRNDMKSIGKGVAGSVEDEGSTRERKLEGSKEDVVDEGAYHIALVLCMHICMYRLDCVVMKLACIVLSYCHLHFATKCLGRYFHS